MMRDTRFEEEGYDDVDLVSSRKEGKGTGRKANPRKLKHSETEQRRRLKINERFQVLMDLIPQNDQKRDKASFLLEVIQYIQFLQAKINMYENWSEVPSKLVPRRNSIAPVESFIDQQHLMRNGSAQEDNYIFSPSVLLNAQNSLNQGSAEAISQSNNLEKVPNQPHQSPISHPVFQGSHSQLLFCQSRLFSTESNPPNYVSNEAEMRTGSGEARISNAYSQGLLNNLTQALRSSGVDLTQASISVQLDVSKGGDTGLPSTMLNSKLSPEPVVSLLIELRKNKDCNKSNTIYQPSNLPSSFSSDFLFLPYINCVLLPTLSIPFCLVDFRGDKEPGTNMFCYLMCRN